MITPTFIPVIRRKRNPHIDPNYKAHSQSEPRRTEPGEVAKVTEPKSQEQKAEAPGGGGGEGLKTNRENLVTLIAARAESLKPLTGRALLIPQAKAKTNAPKVRKSKQHPVPILVSKQA